MAKMNPFETLGVALDAPDAEIKQAYRKAALANHPDKVGPPGTAKMAAINASFDILSDPIKRLKAAAEFNAKATYASKASTPRPAKADRPCPHDRTKTCFECRYHAQRKAEAEQKQREKARWASYQYQPEQEEPKPEPEPYDPRKPDQAPCVHDIVRACTRCRQARRKAKAEQRQQEEAEFAYQHQPKQEQPAPQPKPERKQERKPEAEPPRDPFASRSGFANKAAFYDFADMRGSMPKFDFNSAFEEAFAGFPSPPRQNRHRWNSQDV